MNNVLVLVIVLVVIIIVIGITNYVGAFSQKQQDDSRKEVSAQSPTQDERGRKAIDEDFYRRRGIKPATLLAKEILEKGGPKTLDEYRFLFPDACIKCGSIDFVETDTFRLAAHFDSYDQRDNGFVSHGIYCCKCLHTISEQFVGEVDSQLEFQEKNSPRVYRVQSPYLSEAEAARFPNFGDQ